MEVWGWWQKEDEAFRAVQCSARQGRSLLDNSSSFPLPWFLLHLVSLLPPETGKLWQYGFVEAARAHVCDWLWMCQDEATVILPRRRPSYQANVSLTRVSNQHAPPFVPSAVWSRTSHSVGNLFPWFLMRSLSSSRPRSAQSNRGPCWCGSWEETGRRNTNNALSLHADCFPRHHYFQPAREAD